LIIQRNLGQTKKEERPPAQNLSGLSAAFFLAKKMGKVLGGSRVL